MVNNIIHDKMVFKIRLFHQLDRSGASLSCSSCTLPPRVALILHSPFTFFSSCVLHKGSPFPLLRLPFFFHSYSSSMFWRSWIVPPHGWLHGGAQSRGSPCYQTLKDDRLGQHVRGHQYGFGRTPVSQSLDWRAWNHQRRWLNGSLETCFRPAL